MKATCAYLAGTRRIEFCEREVVPARDEVLIRVAACGICRGDVRAYVNTKHEIREFGHELVGHVVEKGGNVEHLEVGDWVAGAAFGSYGTHVTAKAGNVYPIPKELGISGCLTEPLKCVTTAVRTAAPDFGDVVVVAGCGFMGLSAIAAFKGHWERELIAVEPIEARRALALRFGATRAFDPAGCDVRGEILQLTDGRGADVAVEFAGSADVAALAAGLLRKRGRLVIAGGWSAAGNIYGSAVTVHHVPPAFSPDEADDYRRVIHAISRGLFPIDDLITHRFNLDEIRSAFDVASSGDPAYLKGVIVNDTDQA